MTKKIKKLLFINISLILSLQFTSLLAQSFESSLITNEILSGLISGKGQSHWCSTENSQNGTTINRGYCGSSCPLPDGEERCKTEQNELCIFPFKFNDLGSRTTYTPTGSISGSSHRPNTSLSMMLEMLSWLLLL